MICLQSTVGLEFLSGSKKKQIQDKTSKNSIEVFKFQSGTILYELPYQGILFIAQLTKEVKEVKCVLKNNK